MSDDLISVFEIREIADRIRQRLVEKNLSPRAASLKTSRGPDLIRNLLRAANTAKPYHPRVDTVNAIADALDVNPLWLQFGGRHEKERRQSSSLTKKETSDDDLFYSSDALEYVGVLEAGVYRMVIFEGTLIDLPVVEVPWPSAPDRRPSVSADPRYPNLKQSAWIARGDVGAKAGIQDGMCVLSVSFIHYLAKVGPIRHGMLVILERQRKEGSFSFVEMSLREFQIWTDKFTLAPLTRSPHHEPIDLPRDWAPWMPGAEEALSGCIIRGVATGAYLAFENEGFIPQTS